jgi:hypothetical protein
MASRCDDGHDNAHDYGCEIISFVVLLVLSALSHFWYIMIVVCAGTAFWATSAVLRRAIVNRMVATAPEVGRQIERESPEAAAGMPRSSFDPGGPAPACCVAGVSQKSL